MSLLSVVVVVLALLANATAFVVLDCHQSRTDRVACPTRLVSATSRLNAKVGSLTSTTKSAASNVKDNTRIGNVALLLPSIGSDTKQSKFGAKSPVDPPTYLEAATHLVNKISWFADGLVDVDIVIIGGMDASEQELLLLEVDVLVALGLETDSDVEYAKEMFDRRRQRDQSLRQGQCHFGLDCGGNLASMVGPFDSANPSVSATVIPWSQDATGLRLDQQMAALLERWTSDDFALAVVLFFNQFSGSKVDWVKYSIDATWEKGPVQNAKEFYQMVSKCGDCIAKCLADENCKTCIDALNAVDTRDQVASYRTIVSFESELLKEFSYCILQKNNVFGCRSKIPMIPKVEPIPSFRGETLTTELARSLLVGHLKDEPIAPEGGLEMDVSWKVAAGANVAYDQFPSQNQLFYEDVESDKMWYDPVFRVETIDGRNVWCKRHYAVRNGKVPGTFRLSVLDNGVTSNEFWTIGGVADDLSWIVFHYAGAATAVGQRYLGGLLCTPDGNLPQEEDKDKVWDALQRVHIQPWELYVVDNNPDSPGAMDAGPPPLYHYRNPLLQERAKRARTKTSM